MDEDEDDDEGYPPSCWSWVTNACSWARLSNGMSPVPAGFPVAMIARQKDGLWTWSAPNLPGSPSSDVPKTLAQTVRDADIFLFGDDLISEAQLHDHLAFESDEGVSEDVEPEIH
jgi:hypothetical protein